MASYRVTDTQEVQTMTPAGTTLTKYRVWIETENGARGTLDVDKKDWNQEQLPVLLQQRADKLDLAFTLTSV